MRVCERTELLKPNFKLIQEYKSTKGSIPPRKPTEELNRIIISVCFIDKQGVNYVIKMES